ncbi:MAG: glycosyltransferase family 2 protein [Desulfuromonadales bacterium]
MKTEPTLNEPTNPMVSILIYNYNGQYLRQCLESIFQQEALDNFEIILIDDATSDGSWETAREFAGLYPQFITIHRNKITLGHAPNLSNCLVMAKGEFCTILTGTVAFLPEYIADCVTAMISDHYARFALVSRANDSYPYPMSKSVPLPMPFPLPSILKRPLVSILCYNYNYGRYLRQCLESVFAQTYENLELCFSDNASTDDSWAIALEFERKHPGKMSLTRNRKNFGPDANFANCFRTMGGKYFVNFCSDDVLAPEYVERCVSALEAYPNTGMAIVNRSVINENDIGTDEAPFYNQSCIIPGEEQAAVYMMAGVNPSVSQIMYRRDVVNGRTATGALVSRYYGTRIFDFNISTDFDVAYIKEPLLKHRIHSQSDTNKADSSLLPVIGLYVLNQQFADIASLRNLTKVTDRLPKSIDKLANLAVRYSVRSLLAQDERTAQRYFYLAMAMSPQLAEEPTWRQLQQYWAAEESRKSEILEEFRTSDNLAARTTSYEPPPGSTPI